MLDEHIGDLSLTFWNQPREGKAPLGWEPQGLQAADNTGG